MINLKKSHSYLQTIPSFLPLLGMMIGIPVIAAICISCSSSDAPSAVQQTAAPAAVQVTPAAEQEASAPTGVFFATENAPGCTPVRTGMTTKEAVRSCWGKPTMINRLDQRVDSDKVSDEDRTDDETWTFKHADGRADSVLEFWGGTLGKATHNINPDEYTK